LVKLKCDGGIGMSEKAKQLVKRGRPIPKPAPDMLHKVPVYKVYDEYDDIYIAKKFYWNCAVCGREFVARREAIWCACSHCPKCGKTLMFVAPRVLQSGLITEPTWLCECKFISHHSPKDGKTQAEWLEIDDQEAIEAEAKAMDEYDRLDRGSTRRCCGSCADVGCADYQEAATKRTISRHALGANCRDYVREGGAPE
jgi:ssDNA-binding Zn-finger/Zn-ribbon topoisomerase 1